MTKVFLLHFHFFTSDKACKPGICCHPLHICVRSLDMFFKIIISAALVVTVFTSFQWFTLTAVVWFYMCAKMAFVLKCFSTLSTFPRLLDLLWFSLCTLCTRLVCLLRLTLSLVSYGHSSHLWVLFSLVTAVLCFLMWLSKVFFPITVSPQFSHVYEFVSCALTWCKYKSASTEKFLPHSGQRNVPIVFQWPWSTDQRNPVWLPKLSLLVNFS